MGVQINGDTGNISATKADYSGNVTIGGTLTYEDVTNIDSVGLVTARSGLEIGARPGVAASISVDGNMIVSGISTFGGDVQVPDKIIHSGDTNTAIRFPEADTVTAETGGSERLRIDSSGRIAFGGVSNNSSYDTNARNILLANESGNIGITIRSGGGDPYAMIHFADGTTDASEFRAGRIIYSHQYDSMSFSTANTQRVKIDSSGRLLVGTDTEGFSGADNLTIEDSGHCGITIRSGSDDDAQVCFSDATSGDGEYAGQIVYDHTDNFMMFRTNGGSEVLRMHSDKRISVNTTTKYGTIHSHEDEFTPNDSRWLTDASYVASGSYGGGYVLLDGSKGYSMYCAQNGNDFYIRHHASTTDGVSGGVYINNGGTSWDSASDERDKENFVTISDAITKIKTLRTVTGNYTWQPEERHAFLIAQDVQAVLPEAVSVTNKDAATEDQRLSLRYTEVIPLLVKAMQEQQEEIESLKARLDAAGL